MYNINKNNSIFNENDCISDDIQLLIEEAINHFNKRRIRKSTNDARFFYTKVELKKVLENLDDPNSVEVIIHKDFDGSVFCYEINRVSFCAEKRNFKRKG